ncbi:lysozyme inhibitor LprI family protein [Ralstonia pseudosolanacearum]|uniref:lysozyme inhibitor LprI family protein n=1 Tax=Ralstonia pseudosolanacearum TaxID=1310165 RepID=UPI0009BFBF86|nr:lysozyme inhibitor LprI family protein [Ralstonia pseudosolanacearum]
MQNNQNQPIWNPSTVAGLSFVFTPAFGSILQASNWRSLGQPERAATSKAWFYVSLLVLAAMAAAVCFAAKAGGDSDAVGGFLNIGGLVYFFIWYVASGRKQVSFVKDGFGKTYAKKSLVKPVLAALACTVAYAVVIFGLLFATQGSSDEDGQVADQGSSAGSSFSLASLFSAAPKLDCASPDVKKIITDTYAEQLSDTGIPDLAMAIERKRINFRVEMITETGRNTASQFANCKGNLVITFPDEDLAKARKVLGDGGISGIFSEAIRKTGPMFNEEITYRVSVPADKEERKNGPLVEITFVNAKEASSNFRMYGSAYGALAYTVADVSASKRNDVKWDKAYKDAVAQECGKQSNLDLCRCRLDQFEQVLSQDDFQRIGYIVQTKTLDPAKYPNFIALSDGLNKQCPLPQGIASVLGASGDAASAQVSPSEGTPAVEAAPATAAAAPQPAPQAPTAQPDASTPAIAASFDCGKAASKIEKLICSTSETADADRRLAAAYRTATAKSSDPAALKQQQRDWMKERNACADAACLISATEARIQALSTM